MVGQTGKSTDHAHKRIRMGLRGQTILGIQSAYTDHGSSSLYIYALPSRGRTGHQSQGKSNDLSDLLIAFLVGIKSCNPVTYSICIGITQARQNTLRRLNGNKRGERFHSTITGRILIHGFVTVIEIQTLPGCCCFQCCLVHTLTGSTPRRTEPDKDGLRGIRIGIIPDGFKLFLGSERNHLCWDQIVDQTFHRTAANQSDQRGPQRQRFRG